MDGMGIWADIGYGITAAPGIYPWNINRGRSECGRRGSSVNQENSKARIQERLSG
jgi:hypothetical protein